MGLKLYQLTEAEQQDLINRLTSDISFQDEELEVESDDVDHEEFDLEAFANDEET